MTEMLKIGVLGGGINSAVGKLHRQALATLDNVQVVRGCFSRDPGTNLSSGEAWRVRKIDLANSIDELLSPGVDYVVNLTPTNQHFETNSKILQAGKNLISEKAISTSGTQAEELARQMDSYGVRAFSVFNYSFYPVLRDLAFLIKAGEFGDIFFLDAEMLQDSYFRHLDSTGRLQTQDWRLRDYVLPTIHLDLGVHLINTVSYLAGSDVSDGSIAKRSRGAVPGLIDTCFGNITLKNGADVSLRFSKVALGSPNSLSIRVFGTKGSASWNQLAPDILEVSTRHSSKSLMYRGESRMPFSSRESNSVFKTGHTSGFLESMSLFYSSIFGSHVQGEFQSSGGNTSLKTAARELMTSELLYAT